MTYSDRITPKGHIQLYKNGELVRELDNLVVTIGKGLAAQLIGGLSITAFTYIQIGTGTTAATIANTTLETYNAEGSVTPTEAGGVLTLDKTFTFAGTVAVTEGGVFNGAQADAPDMLCRQVWTAITFYANDKLRAVWAVTVA